MDYVTFKSTLAGLQMEKALTDAFRMLHKGESDPETTTAGYIGQQYLNTSSGEWFRLSAIEGDTYTWTKLVDYTPEAEEALAAAVPGSRTINGETLANDITLTGSHIALTGMTEAETYSAIADTDTVNTAFGKVKKFFTDIAATVRAVVLTGLSTASDTAVTASDSILVAIGKLQAQVNARVINTRKINNQALTEDVLFSVYSSTSGNTQIKQLTRYSGSTPSLVANTIFAVNFTHTNTFSGSIKLNGCGLTNASILNTGSGPFTADYTYLFLVSNASLVFLIGSSKGSVGLGNVDNTSDADKPISTAAAAAMGDLEDLDTTEKGSLVGAINENNALISTNTSDIATNTIYITKLQTYMGNFIEDFLPYGVSWNKGESPTLLRTDFAEGMVANIGIDDQIVTNNFDSAPIYREIHDVVDTLGNVFVRIPKFYIKKTDGVDLKTWSISKYKHDGYYLPWCFWDFTNSRELPYVDIGRYNGSLDGTKLASKAGTYPLIGKNIVEFRGYAQANNTGGLLGYQQLDIHAIDVWRTLYFIEFGTLNTQSIMRGFTEGQYTATHVATATENAANRIVVANATADLYRVGQAISVGTSQGGNQIFYGRTITGITVVDESNKAVEFDGDPVDITTGNYLYNTGWKSGFSSNISASSGVITANDGKYPCAYRGIENPFGGVWQFVDGVNITNNQAWVCKNAEQYASNVFAAPYEKLDYVNHNANGYGPISMGFDSNLPFAEFATSVGGDTSKYYADYYYQGTASRIARFGGNWLNGLNAGLSCWRLAHLSSDSDISLGGRLLKKPL